MFCESADTWEDTRIPRTAKVRKYSYLAELLNGKKPNLTEIKRYSRNKIPQMLTLICNYILLFHLRHLFALPISSPEQVNTWKKATTRSATHKLIMNRCMGAWCFLLRSNTHSTKPLPRVVSASTRLSTPISACARAWSRGLTVPGCEVGPHVEVVLFWEGSSHRKASVLLKLLLRLNRERLDWAKSTSQEAAFMPVA